MRDVLSSKLQATSRKDGKLEVDIFKWLNKVTLDIIGLAGSCTPYPTLYRAWTSTPAVTD